MLGKLDSTRPISFYPIKTWCDTRWGYDSLTGAPKRRKNDKKNKNKNRTRTAVTATEDATAAPTCTCCPPARWSTSSPPSSSSTTSTSSSSATISATPTTSNGCFFLFLFFVKRHLRISSRFCFLFYRRSWPCSAIFLKIESTRWNRKTRPIFVKYVMHCLWKQLFWDYFVK